MKTNPIQFRCECGQTLAAVRVWPVYCACRRVHREPAGVEQVATLGPGSELKSLLAELGIKSFEGCSCQAKVRQMDRWGVAGCRENFDTIRGWIVEAQAKAGWATTIGSAIRAATNGFALSIDPTDIAGSLVRIAIERAT